MSQLGDGSIGRSPASDPFDSSHSTTSSTTSPHRNEEFTKSERSKSTSRLDTSGYDEDSGNHSPPRARTKTFLETCTMAQDLGAEKYPQFVKLQFLEVLARNHYDRPLVVVYGCRLPVIKTSIEKDVISYIKDTLDVLVENEYDAIYFNYNATLSSLASFAVLRKAYGEFDRKYKKNIKTLYVVHPSRAMMLLYGAFKGFISKKFERKLRLVKNLKELESVVNLELMHIPMSIKSYDTDRHSWSEFGKEFSQVSLNQNGVPYLFVEAAEYLRRTKATSEVTGLFRVSGSGSTQKTLAKKYSVSPESFTFPERTNAHDVAGLVKQFLQQLPTPLLMFSIMKLENYDEQTIMNYLRENLDESRKATMVVMFGLLEEVIANQATNSMSEENIMRCVSMSLAWSESPDFHDLERMEMVFGVLLRNYRTLVP